MNKNNAAYETIDDMSIKNTNQIRERSKFKKHF